MKSYANVFKNLNFDKLFISINMNNLSQSFANLTILWLIYKATNQPILIGVSSGAMLLPNLLTSVFLGSIIDKYSTVKVMSYVVLIKSLLFLILFFIPMDLTIVSITIILVVLVINSMLTPIVSTSTSIIINEIFNGNELITANSLLNIAFDISYILGSVASGILVSIGYGNKVFLLTSLSFFLTALLLLTIKVETMRKSKKRVLDSIKIGFSFIFKDKAFLNMMVTTSLWDLFTWGSISVVLPIYVTHVLKKDSEIYGVLNSMQSVGIIFGSFIIGSITIINKNMNFIYYLIVLQSLFLCLFALQNNWLMSIIFLIVAGVISAPIMIYKSTYFQLRTPKEIQGQVFSIINTVGSLLYSIGGILVGGLATFINPEKIGYLLVMSSVLMIFVSLIVLFILKISIIKKHEV